jgi:TRAF-type zinc finger
LKEDIRPAAKIISSLVEELAVACPRGCGVNVQRGSLKGHLKGTCDLENIVCSCGEMITRKDLRSVLEEEESEKEDVCIHEWHICSGCSDRYQRLDKKVFAHLFQLT